MPPLSRGEITRAARSTPTTNSTPTTKLWNDAWPSRSGLGAPPPRGARALLTSASMTSITSAVSRVAGVVGLIVVAAVSACTPRPDGPGPVAEQFFATLSTGNTGVAAQFTDRPADARAALNAAWSGLQANHLDAELLSSRFEEDTGTITYRYTWHLPKNRTWTYEGRLAMIRQEGRWEIRWTPAALHPRLGERQTFALRADAPQRASVNELRGTNVLTPGYLYHYELDAKKTNGQLFTNVRAVVDALRPFDNTLDAQRLAAQASSSKRPVDLITLRPDDNDR